MQKDITSPSVGSELLYLFIKIDTENSITYVAIFSIPSGKKAQNMVFAGVGNRRIIIFILITLKELLNTSIEVTEDSEFTIMSQEINELAQCVEG